MPRPEQMEKTISLYLPSKKALDALREDAEKSGSSLSNYIIEMVARGKGSQESPRPDLIRENSELKEELGQLRSQLRTKDLLLERLQADLFKTRYGRESQHIDDKLIEILKRGRVIDGYSILKELGISPKDTEAMRLVNNQLETLQQFGLVKESTGGWRWV